MNLAHAEAEKNLKSVVVNSPVGFEEKMRKSHKIITLKLLSFLFSITCFGETLKSPESTLLIETAVICEAVVNRVPVGESDIFPKEIQRLYCFSKVTGAAEDTVVAHKWYYKDKAVSAVYLKVRSKNWRTYSNIRIRPEKTGEWKVEIISSKKKILKTIYFMIE